MTQEIQDDINGDICALRCAIRGLINNKKLLKPKNKAEIVEIYNALGVLVIENIEVIT